MALDVTDERQAVAAAGAAIARFGSIDVLVNNAGRGLLGAVEETSAAEVEAVFATNVFGLLNVTRAVLPHMRAAHSGQVVNISPMGGFAQVAGRGVYGATKFAVEDLSEAMQAELSPLGIKVTICRARQFSHQLPRWQFAAHHGERVAGLCLHRLPGAAGRRDEQGRSDQ